MEEEFEEASPRTRLTALVEGKHGSWTSELTWVESDGAVRTEVRSDTVPRLDNVGCELHGIVDALKMARSRDAEVTLCVCNESNFDTGLSRLSEWAKNGWKRADGKEVKHRQLWELVFDIVQHIPVTWRSAKAKEIRGFQLAGALAEEAMDAEAGDLIQRAIDRDRF